MNNITFSNNETIAAFNKGIKAEAYAAELAGKAAKKAAGGIVTQEVIDKAKRAAWDTQDFINAKAAANKAKKAPSGVATETVAKKVGKWVVGFIPFASAGITFFKTGDANAAGKEAFLDLTGLDKGAFPYCGGSCVGFSGVMSRQRQRVQILRSSVAGPSSSRGDHLGGLARAWLAAVRPSGR